MSEDTPSNKSNRPRGKNYKMLRETSDAEDAQFGVCLKEEFKHRPDLFRGQINVLREKNPPRHIGAVSTTTKDGSEIAFPFAGNLTLEFPPAKPLSAADRIADDRAAQYLTDTYIGCDPNGKNTWPKTWAKLKKTPKAPAR